MAKADRVQWVLSSVLGRHHKLVFICKWYSYSNVECKLIKGYSVYSLNDPAREGILFAWLLLRIIHLH